MTNIQPAGGASVASAVDGKLYGRPPRITAITEEDCVLINYHITTIEDIALSNAVASIYKIHEELGYQITELVYGKHRNANQPHSHIHTISTIPVGTKIYKILNEKIKRTKNFSEWRSDKKDKMSYRIGISFNYTNNKQEHYHSLAYPLKEYKNPENIGQDLCHVEDYIDKTKWEEYRVFANTIYEAKLKILKREKEKEAKQLSETEYLYEFLNSQFKQGTGEIMDSVEMRGTISNCIILCLGYYRKKGKKFNCNTLRNVVVNYLYQRQIIHEYNVIEYLKI